MTEPVPPGEGPSVQTLQAEIARLNKIIQALMNRAERTASLSRSDFNLFHTAITLEEQVRRRTLELEASRRENERITRDLRESERQIRHLAFYDPLTQLANRRLLTDRLKHAMATSARRGCYGAVVFLDLDSFKPLNDEYGHDAGDLLLIEVSNRLTRCVRTVDTVARMGGDEFVILLGDLKPSYRSSIDESSAVAERIRATLADPYLLAHKRDGATATTVEHQCTASIGVILFLGHRASQEDIFKQADSAMYQAKSEGRNVICFFDHAP